MRAADVVARLGGDEFAILLVHAVAALAAAVAAKLVDALSEPCELDGLAVAISASIGVASYPQSGADAETLLKRTDEAMYKVKLGGRRGHPLESTFKRLKSEP